MRQLILLSFICLSIGCSSTRKTNLKSDLLNGNWIPVKQELSGNSLPATVYGNQKLIISDSSYTVIAESIDKGVVRYTDNKMDIYGKEGVNAGKHFTAIYKIENGQLTICYDLSGKSYPESFETKGKPMCFLSVFTKDQAK
jgi:uncharacterized protein (TIGR03067 family)